MVPILTWRGQNCLSVRHVIVMMVVTIRFSDHAPDFHHVWPMTGVTIA
ncbi:MAG: hypothetical protein IPL78_18675 [Chloroflexi bacterium]|nr:hypothetical protein [Chloroflexota bacterium]